MTKLHLKNEKKFLSKIIQRYLSDHDRFDLDQLVETASSSSCVIVDNRNSQLESNLNLIKFLENHADHQNPLEDLFLMPDKMFLLLKFKSAEMTRKIEKVNSELSFTMIPDVIFEKISSKYQLIVDDIVKLFEIENQPEDFRIFENFIYRSEDSDLISLAEHHFERARFFGKISSSENFESIHFGYAFDPNNLLDSALPTTFDKFIDRFKNFLPEKPDQLSIESFDPRKGQHIPMHCDNHSMFTEWTASFSVGSDVVLSWKNRMNHQAALTFFPSRSLMIIQNESRYLWDHGIARTVSDLIPMSDCSRKLYGIDRPCLSLSKRSKWYGFTFRKIRSSTKGPCVCDECRSQNQYLEIGNDPEKLENQFVHHTYDEIADHFSETRYKCWPNVSKFLHSLYPGSIVLDVGCGNGRFLGENPQIITLGTDHSANLLEICNRKNFETFIDDCLSIDSTLRNGIFDAILSIAVVHHFASDARRLRAIHAILNLLADNGQALIYVWAFEQQRNGSRTKYLKSIEKGKKIKCENGKTTESEDGQNLVLRIHSNRTEFREQDMLVPWSRKNSSNNLDGKYYRYYHLFKENELERLVEKIQIDETNYQCEIVKSFYDEGNWCVLVKKRLTTT
ncbi:Alkylated DNA repair protein alkB -like protein 8 [Sarcoptes scabiei]|uniref:Alkylated DNA repair protein alkB -like protein 8 n=1 Tax=Sarcoptes scabiei TaxID=52283 RepID=A0A834RBN6_SARSC|nr:Alkylated DNA repair protein alkB -like protein 8 [Sarcoptes scabiei]